MCVFVCSFELFFVFAFKPKARIINMNSCLLKKNVMDILV